MSAQSESSDDDEGWFCTDLCDHAAGAYYCEKPWCHAHVDDHVCVDRQYLLDALVCLHYLGRLGGKRCGACPPCELAARVEVPDQPDFDGNSER